MEENYKYLKKNYEDIRASSLNNLLQNIKNLFPFLSNEQKDKVREEVKEQEGKSNVNPLADWDLPSSTKDHPEQYSILEKRFFPKFSKE